MTAKLPKQNEEIWDCRPETTARKSCRRTKYGAPLRRRRITSAGRQTPNKHERSRSSSIARVTHLLQASHLHRTCSQTHVGGGHYTCCKLLISTTPHWPVLKHPQHLLLRTTHTSCSIQFAAMTLVHTRQYHSGAPAWSCTGVKDCAVQLHQKAFCSTFVFIMAERCNAGEAHDSSNTKNKRFLKRSRNQANRWPTIDNL